MIRLLRYLRSLMNAARRRSNLRSSILKMDNDALLIVKRYEANISVLELSHAERAEVQNVWSKYSDVLPGDAYFRLARMGHGEFSAEYVPESMLYTGIQWTLNDSKIARFVENKGLYGIYFKSERRPFEPIRNILGCFYDSDNNLITKEAAVDLLVAFARPFIIKPSVLSERGANVLKIKNYDRMYVQHLFETYKSDFLCQEVCSQNEVMASLNRTSLNCVRVTSLFLNGKYTALSLTVKIGGIGKDIDNVGAGGYLVGIHPDGHLMDRGFDTQGNVRSRTYDDIPLNSIHIPNFEKVLAFAKRLHLLVPHMPLLGWDIAIGADNEPIMIEVNAFSPGIVYEQMCTGPIFGDRFGEVMDYIRERKEK